MIKYSIPIDIWESDLSAGARDLYFALKRFCGPRENCWPANWRLISLLRISDRTLRRRKQELIEKGWLKINPRHAIDRTQRSNNYWLLNPISPICRGTPAQVPGSIVKEKGSELPKGSFINGKAPKAAKAAIPFHARGPDIGDFLNQFGQMWESRNAGGKFYLPPEAQGSVGYLVRLYGLEGAVSLATLWFEDGRPWSDWAKRTRYNVGAMAHVAPRIVDAPEWRSRKNKAINSQWEEQVSPNEISEFLGNLSKKFSGP